MKTKNIILALGAAVLAFTSCSGFLEEDPKGKLTPDTFFSSQDELNMSVVALYAQVASVQCNTNGQIPYCQGDDITANPGSNKQAYAETDAFKPADSNKGVERAWNTAYSIVKAANYIILNADKAPVSDAEKNIAIGQARFWRAWAYFRLVRLWGPVPKIEVPEISSEMVTPASVEEIYDLIINDLKACVEILPTSYSGAPRANSGANVYITRQASQSMLAAVYLASAGWPLKKTENYALAEQAAKAVIDGVNAGRYEYMLEPEFKHVYAPSHRWSNETVVGISYTTAFGAWSNQASQETSSNLFESLGGWGDAWGEIQFWKDYPASARKDAVYCPQILIPNKADGVLHNWWDKENVEQHPMFSVLSVGPGDTDYDYRKPASTSMCNSARHRVIRYAEVLLWYAEAVGRQGRTDAAAVNALNQVRRRAGESELSGLSAAQLADWAFKEHGWEVAGYWNACVTRRDDQMRMELLKDAFEARKADKVIEVAPGVFVKESVKIDAATTWQGEASIYMPYPSVDRSLNTNLKR